MTRVVAVLTILAVASVAAWPLEAQTRDTARVRPVVTTATRTPIPERDVPAAVTVITGAQLRALGITSVADALAATPSVMVARNGSFGGLTSLFLRGGQSDYVKVLVDGVPVNDPGGAFDFGSLTTDNIERIEILRGPASVLYGADAVSGVVQIFTRSGTTPPRIDLTARGGSYGTGDASVAVRGGIPLQAGAGAGYSLSVSRHQTDGIYRFNNRFTDNVVSGRADFRPDQADSLSLTLRYTDSRYHYPTNSGGQVVDHNAFDAGDGVVLGAAYEHAFSPLASLDVDLTSDGTNGGTTDRPDTAGGDQTLSMDDIQRHAADARLILRDAEGRGNVTLGASLSAADEHSQSQSVYGGVPYTSEFSAYRRNRAVYAQLLWRRPTPLTAVVGARLDDNQEFGTFATYRAGLNYVTAGGTRLRASVGTAFRAPTFYENFSTGYVTGNPSLRPEHALSWEGGIDQSLFAGRVTLGATVFSQLFRDLIDYTGGTTACGYSYCNVARARAAGIEYSVTAAPASFLSASFGLTHLQTRVLTAGFDTTSGGLYHLGQPLIRRPTTSWNASLQAASASRGSVDLRWMYVGQRADRDFRSYPALPVTMPAFLRVDVGASYPLARGPDDRGTTLTLRVENLTNADYQTVFNFLSPGRTVLAGVRVVM